CFFFSSRRRHTRCLSDWSSDVCSSDLEAGSGISEFADWPMVHAAALIDRPSGRQAVGPSYAELHCHSAYSFLDGASPPDEILAEIGRASCRERVYIWVVSGCCMGMRRE